MKLCWTGPRRDDPSSAACGKHGMLLMAWRTFQDCFPCNALTQSTFQGWMPHHSTTDEAAYIKLGLGLTWGFFLYITWTKKKESKFEFVMSKIFLYYYFSLSKKRKEINICDISSACHNIGHLIAGHPP